MDKIKILIVENEIVSATFIEACVKKLGYEVIGVVGSGEEAIISALKLLPDLVLMDISLNGELDGIDTTKRLNEIKDLPVIYLTANKEKETIDRAKITDPFGYLVKPFTLDEIYRTIEIALFKYDMEFKLKSNMEEARRFQEKLIPRKLPELPNIEVKANYYPAIKVGGDIYDFYEIDNKLIVILADVCGHGVPAAMMASYIKAHIKQFITMNKITDPAEILNNLKEMIINEELFQDKFITMFAASIDKETLMLEYANAGHCFPFIYRDNSILEMTEGDILIMSGIKEDKYKNHRFKLQKKDKLFIYTDGIYEWQLKSKDRAILGISNLKKYLLKSKFKNEDIEKFISSVKRIREFTDDVSYILLDFI